MSFWSSAAISGLSISSNTDVTFTKAGSAKPMRTAYACLKASIIRCNPSTPTVPTVSPYFARMLRIYTQEKMLRTCTREISLMRKGETTAFIYQVFHSSLKPNLEMENLSDVPKQRKHHQRKEEASPKL